MKQATAQIIEILILVLILATLLFLGYEKTFLEYKVVIVEKDLLGNYTILTEQIIKGQQRYFSESEIVFPILQNMS